MAKAAIGQICSSNSMAHNLEQCVKLVGQAAAAGAKVLFLPEASDYIGTSAAESLSLAKPISSSPFVNGLCSAAAEHNLAVHVGIHVPVAVKPTTDTSNPVLNSVPESEDADTIAATSPSPSSPPPSDQAAKPDTPSPKIKLYNRTIYITPTGTLLENSSYDKLHLFNYPNASLRESTTTQAGSRFTPPFPSPIGRLGSLICFDLRFPEAALHLTTRSHMTPPSYPLANPVPNSPNPLNPSSYPSPAQILLYPSAFTVATGTAHWLPLLRARAIETQSYVIAAAQVGLHNPGSSGRVSYGRSAVIDPWGREVLVMKGVKGEEGKEEAEEGAVGELGVVEIDLKEWERVREGMPLVRRTDVYPEV
ncbi:carbon-nitrogen hydrolase [Annulohypoxylon maeteangense]|uniref:carbon-nitrogen hydrolase n=1 Tax=Annulohypoxylon maeteangense TaxID=1927788 RepID=UPI00200818EF|nr:carbon-nitrogen hydrolase [Annulohypoxylon maeteangense]KAI0884615.1 carbon-nitrogen hydrolase [Annulohypoxylon maeteangense]